MSNAVYRDEGRFLTDHILSQMESRGELLPGAKQRISQDVHRVARTAPEAARGIFDYLEGPGRRYLRDPESVIQRGAAQLKHVLHSLPVRAGARDRVFEKLAVELSDLTPGEQAERVAELLEQRKNRDWHENPRPLPLSERRAADMIRACAPNLRPGVDVEGLAQKFSRDIAGLPDRTALEIVAGRLQSGGHLDSEVDLYTAVGTYDSAKQAADDGTTLEADRAKLRYVYGAENTVF